MDDYWNVILPDDRLREISSIGLAYMGDAAYEVLARAYLCAHGKATGKNLHRAAVELVRAESQAARAAAILPLLTEEEAAVYKRGRNAQVHTVPAHASRAQYAAATAVEALFGWLYLRGERDRANELFCIMMDAEVK